MLPKRYDLHSGNGVPHIHGGRAHTGSYIVAWRVGFKSLPCRYNDKDFTVRSVVSLQGKNKQGDWLQKLGQDDLDTCEEVPEHEDGFSELTGKCGGFLTNFMGLGDDRDDEWTFTAPSELKQPCKIVGHQLCTVAEVEGAAVARFQFAGAGERKRLTDFLLKLSSLVS